MGDIDIKVLDATLCCWMTLTDAYPSLKNSQAPGTRICWSRTSRKTQKTSGWSRSRWRNAPPQVGGLGVCFWQKLTGSYRTNFDKYHPGYFGKVGMRHFHLTRNMHWRPTINVDKL